MAPLTASVKAGEVLVVKFASPLYIADSEWFPADRVVKASVAIPPFRGLEASAAVPSWNVTLPVADGGVTVAVSVRLCPAGEGLAEEVRIVVLVA